MNAARSRCRAWKNSFTPFESEDERDPELQVHQLVDQVAEQEVELPQGPSAANTLAVNTRKALRGCRRSPGSSRAREQGLVVPRAMKTMSTGVKNRFAVDGGLEFGAVETVGDGMRRRSIRDQAVLVRLFVVDRALFRDQ